MPEDHSTIPSVKTNLGTFLTFSSTFKELGIEMPSEIFRLLCKGRLQPCDANGKPVAPPLYCHEFHVLGNEVSDLKCLLGGNEGWHLIAASECGEDVNLDALASCDPALVEEARRVYRAMKEYMDDNVSSIDSQKYYDSWKHLVVPADEEDRKRLLVFLADCYFRRAEIDIYKSQLGDLHKDLEEPEFTPIDPSIEDMLRQLGISRDDVPGIISGHQIISGSEPVDVPDFVYEFWYAARDEENGDPTAAECYHQKAKRLYPDYDIDGAEDDPCRDDWRFFKWPPSNNDKNYRSGKRYEDYRNWVRGAGMNWPEKPAEALKEFLLSTWGGTTRVREVVRERKVSIEDEAGEILAGEPQSQRAKQEKPSGNLKRISLHQLAIAYPCIDEGDGLAKIYIIGLKRNKEVVITNYLGLIGKKKQHKQAEILTHIANNSRHEYQTFSASKYTVTHLRKEIRKVLKKEGYEILDDPFPNEGGNFYKSNIVVIAPPDDFQLEEHISLSDFEDLGEDKKGRMHVQPKYE